MRNTRAKRRRAARKGRLDAFEREHRVTTWTSDPGKAPRPRLTRRGARKVQAARHKKAAGKTLTRREAGRLGGAARVRPRERSR